MNKYLKNLIISIGLALPAYNISPVNATLVSPQETSVILQDIVSAFDFVIAGTSLGIENNSLLNYQSSANLSGWSGNLSGTYLGESANVTYSGDLSSFPSGPITWTSNGAFGTSNLNGIGSALVTDTVDGFSLEVDYSVQFAGGSMVDILTDQVFDVDVTLGGAFVQLQMEDESGMYKDPNTNEWISWTISYKENADGTYTDSIAWTIKDEDTNEFRGGLIQDFSEGRKEKLFPDEDINIDGTILRTVSTPEPTSAVSILAICTFGTASTLKRKLKPSQSPEKETTKVG